MRPTSTAKLSHIVQYMKEWIHSREMTLRDGPIEMPKHEDEIDDDEEYNSRMQYLSHHVESANIVDTVLNPLYNGVVLFWQADLRIYVFQLNEEGSAEEMAEEEGESADLPACRQWVLPCREFHGLWDSLIFDDCIKFNMLEYAATTMLFSDKCVDTQLINWNRVILFHGPPGTGKTSLCKSLAQKLSIRLSHRYNTGQLIEINAHSLFSKWFSESGKLVMKLFNRIQEIVEDEDSFVCVLIDEVESLTAARKSALAGTEPSDSIRVVNAVLTQIDQLKKAKNVLILTTSNITQAIDLAFVDRADIKQYIGPPSCRGRYQILRSCLLELMRVSIIQPQQAIPEWTSSDAAENHYSLKLKHISDMCEGFSGRALRKLPFLAHAFFVQTSSSILDDYLNALEKAVSKESAVRAKLND